MSNTGLCPLLTRISDLDVMERGPDVVWVQVAVGIMSLYIAEWLDCSRCRGFECRDLAIVSRQTRAITVAS